jgi:hypothetical protein
MACLSCALMVIHVNFDFTNAFIISIFSYIIKFSKQRFINIMSDWKATMCSQLPVVW